MEPSDLKAYDREGSSSVSAMIPPLIRRCPDCGHVSLSRRFRAITDDGQRLIECPACEHRIEPIDDPWLK